MKPNPKPVNGGTGPLPPPGKPPIDDCCCCCGAVTITNKIHVNFGGSGKATGTSTNPLGNLALGGVGVSITTQTSSPGAPMSQRGGASSEAASPAAAVGAGPDLSGLRATMLGGATGSLPTTPPMGMGAAGMGPAGMGVGSVGAGANGAGGLAVTHQLRLLRR